MRPRNFLVLLPGEAVDRDAAGDDGALSSEIGGFASEAIQPARSASPRPVLLFAASGDVRELMARSVRGFSLPQTAKMNRSGAGCQVPWQPQRDVCSRRL